MTDTPQSKEIEKYLEKFDKTFLNDDTFSSIHQFKPELSGRLPQAFEDFLRQSLESYAKAQREAAVREVIEAINLDTIAHQEGRCSFPFVAYCAAEEQKIKQDLTDEFLK